MYSILIILQAICISKESHCVCVLMIAEKFKEYTVLDDPTSKNEASKISSDPYGWTVSLSRKLYHSICVILKEVQEHIPKESVKSSNNVSPFSMDDFNRAWYEAFVNRVPEGDLPFVWETKRGRRIAPFGLVRVCNINLDVLPIAVPGNDNSGTNVASRVGNITDNLFNQMLLGIPHICKERAEFPAGAMLLSYLMKEAAAFKGSNFVENQFDASWSDYIWSTPRYKMPLFLDEIFDDYNTFSSFCRKLCAKLYKTNKNQGEECQSYASVLIKLLTRPEERFEYEFFPTDPNKEQQLDDIIRNLIPVSAQHSLGLGFRLRARFCGQVCAKVKRLRIRMGLYTFQVLFHNIFITMCVHLVLLL